MHSSVAFAFSLVASALAITVTAPGSNSLWSENGSQTVSWTSVSTDQSSFDIVFANPSYSINDTLASDVSTSLGTYTVNPPNGASFWDPGNGYRINLMYNGAILAQSGNFNISATGGSSAGSISTTSTSSTSVHPTTISGLVTVVATTTAATATGTGATAVGSSSSDLNPTGAASGAADFFKVSGALVAVAAAAHALIL